MHGILVPVDALRIEDEATLVARSAGRSAREGESPDAEALYVRFILRGEMLAIPLASVERAVTSLGRLTRVPRRQSLPVAVCTIEGRAVTVCDALEMIGGQPRDFALLSQAPAIVVKLEGNARVAVAVEGPLDLICTSEAPRLAIRQVVGALGVSGSLRDGTLLLDGAEMGRRALATVGAVR